MTNGYLPMQMWSIPIFFIIIPVYQYERYELETLVNFNLNGGGPEKPTLHFVMQNQPTLRCDTTSVFVTYAKMPPL